MINIIFTVGGLVANKKLFYNSKNVVWQELGNENEVLNMPCNL